MNITSNLDKLGKLFAISGLLAALPSSPLAWGQRSPVPWRAFFHAEGHELVADTTGQTVCFRGVNLNGLEYGTFFDNPYPGVVGVNYFTPRATDYKSLHAAGVNVIRVPFEWARLVPGWQPTNALPKRLDRRYLATLKQIVSKAGSQRLYVVLDLHDFLKYWSGRSAQVCVADSPPHQQLLAHTWKLLAKEFARNRAVLGYDIMNEPVRQEPGEECGSCNWDAIAQSVVNAIRTVDTNHLIVVEGKNYALASHWPIENGPAPFVTDTLTPPRIAYSPHGFFDFDNDSAYEAGEETGPVQHWEYYLRDRLLPVIEWSRTNNVPIFFGETGVPCTANWTAALEQAFTEFFDPLQLSVTVWHYIDPAHCPPGICALNIAACPDQPQLGMLGRHRGGVYEPGDGFALTPSDTLIYSDPLVVGGQTIPLVNPWTDGSWDQFEREFCATGAVFEGSCALRVWFDRANFAGLKFVHQYGIDGRNFSALRFRIFLTGAGQQDFTIFTTAPVSDCDAGENPVFPPNYVDRQSLSKYLAATPPDQRTGQWLEVLIPLADIVDPAEPILNGIAFQNTGAAQESFYLDEIRLVPPGGDSAATERTGH